MRITSQLLLNPCVRCFGCLFFRTLGYLAVVAMVLILAAVETVILIFPLAQFWIDYPSIPEARMVSGIMWILVGIVVLWGAVEQRKLQQRHPREPSWIKQWWQARKEKVCPLIEWTE